MFLFPVRSRETGGGGDVTCLARSGSAASFWSGELWSVSPVAICLGGNNTHGTRPSWFLGGWALSFSLWFSCTRSREAINAHWVHGFNLKKCSLLCQWEVGHLELAFVVRCQASDLEVTRWNHQTREGERTRTENQRLDPSRGCEKLPVGPVGFKPEPREKSSSRRVTAWSAREAWGWASRKCRWLWWYGNEWIQ